MQRNIAIFMSFAVLASLATATHAGQCEAMPQPGEHNSDLPDNLQNASMTLLFEDSFDDQNNWSAQSTAIGGCPSGAQPECATMPDDWDFYRSSERWKPSSANDNSVKPAAQISSAQSRSPNGKSLIIYDEAWGNPGQWGSDAILAKDLGGYHKELYYEFWIKFQPGYRWHLAENPQGGQNGAKLARITSYTGAPENSRFTFFQGGNGAPLAIMGMNVWKEVSSTQVNQFALYSSTVRCSPHSSNYICANFPTSPIPFLPSRPSFENSFGDGQWHKLGMHVRRNSAPGVTDGFLHQYFDNNLTRSLEGIAFVGANGNIDETFNLFMIGGNMHNYPAPESARLEQWTAFDDVRVYKVN